MLFLKLLLLIPEQLTQNLFITNSFIPLNQIHVIYNQTIEILLNPKLNILVHHREYNYRKLLA